MSCGEAGGSMATAQNGSIVSSPHVTGHINGNVNIINNVSYQHGQETTSDRPDSEEYIKKCQTKLKVFLEDNTKILVEGIGTDGPIPFDNKYTELDITEGSSGEVNTEHEVNELQVKKPSSVENKINLYDIFKLSPNKNYTPRTVLTTGIAGIGKTVSVLKFIRDWVARKEDDQTFDFIFPFTFRDLNLIKDETLSLMTLITRHFNEVEDLKASDYNNLKVLFIFDGLDESKLPLNFEGNGVWRSVADPTTVDILLTNLIKGELMCKASVWITSRPAASAKIPPGFIHRVTEIRGFNDEQKEKYFLKKVKDKDMAQKILEHLQSKPLRSLYIMCHIPVFCWILAKFFQGLLTKTPRGELPKTVTEMYTHFLIVQTKITHEKNYEGKEADKVLIMKLGKLAFEKLQKGNSFEEKDLTSCQIDLTHAVVHSGVCTEIIEEECFLYIQKTYSFIHLTVQEFLASLYVLKTFIDSGQNLLQTQRVLRRNRNLSSLHKKAVDMALESTNGQWYLFLRFLLGLSQDENQKLIQKELGLLEKLSPGSNEETIKYIHKQIKKLSHAHQSINLFHCLNELGEQSLVWLDLSGKKLEDHGMRLLSDGLKSPNCRLQKLTLADCQFSELGCGYLASSLKSNPAHLRVLDLSNNQLKDAGVDHLSEFLKEPLCKLEKLSLKCCSLTDDSCKCLALCRPASLKELDLSDKQQTDRGEELLRDRRCSEIQRLPEKTLESQNDRYSRTTGGQWLPLVVASSFVFFFLLFW